MVWLVSWMLCLPHDKFIFPTFFWLTRFVCLCPFFEFVACISLSIYCIPRTHTWTRACACGHMSYSFLSGTAPQPWIFSTMNKNFHFDLFVSRFVIAIQVERFICVAAIVFTIFVRFQISASGSIAFLFGNTCPPSFCFHFWHLIYEARLLPQNSKVI